MLEYMAQGTVTNKLIETHLVDGNMQPGEEIGLRMDQTLTQDATGTLVMLELEAMNVTRASTEISVQYVDHNLVQTDFKNADDHVFLQSACNRFGIWYSRAGNGVSHPVHQQRFGRPGKTLVGSDSHTPAAGAMGMLAIGAGGIDVARAIAGHPLRLPMPGVLGVYLHGELPDWVSAKDVVLEMLRRYDVKGCVGYVLEYYGPGVQRLSAMDRHVIANMGTEMGATSSVFPADEEVQRYLKSQQREDDYEEWKADEGASYDREDSIDLSALEPLIAKPGSPGNVVSVREVEGEPVHQVVIGSSANPGLRDFWTVAQILKEHSISANVSLDINPTSRQLLENLSLDGSLGQLIHAGARIHQSGCLGCIGMGQAPASGKNSLRTMPRNFPGRSGTLDDSVFLCSPETAVAAALNGEITDPRRLEQTHNIRYPRFHEPENQKINASLLQAPARDAATTELQRGPNIKPLPVFDSPPEEAAFPVLLKAGHNISTDEILRGGTEVLPLRSNIEAISEWAFYQLDPDLPKKARSLESPGFIVVAGENYAQGSSREHAAIAPRYLGQRMTLALSYARIGRKNMINYGILPLIFENSQDYESIDSNDEISWQGLRSSLKSGSATLYNVTQDRKLPVVHDLSEDELETVLAGGVINRIRASARN
ncbi:MAG: aconitate hydratase [Leptospiraceae bacterium]|nr:aconitate hydratase [Leptospiraceae bacterium]